MVEAPRPDLTAQLVSVTATATAPATAPDPPRRRAPDPKHVPRAFTAVEGRYGDVAVAPIWRRLLSLAGILAIAVAVGVGLAALLGAVIGALAEILSNAIG